ncbi:hypothetical protein [Pseudomonas coleopterorum]|uniref:Integrase catalytic domain-containing protein n=1 Tax=Pseudomonas coleopterorum TaxID=1605838 RepID=A0ABR9C2S8_9PSED|nr:hypothetical protein [Pseudomonas coleopterorum]MBD8755654.1 hypothetical protein [Pseudomonas coleopterorum]MBD8771634.1 hypothetical protein [Pseudomonas coleopterorum]
MTDEREEPTVPLQNATDPLVSAAEGGVVGLHEERHIDATNASASASEFEKGPPIRQVISSSGRIVPCSYLDHPGFDTTSNLCISLHYIVVKLSPRRSATWAYALTNSISSFLSYRDEYNKSHYGQARLVHLKDLTPSVFKAYMNSLRKSKSNMAIAFRLKSAIRQAARETEFIPLIDLPRVTVQKGEPTEPLYEDGLESLTNVTKGIIDQIRIKIENRSEIDEATPYTFEELKALRTATLTNDQIFGWYKFRIDQQLPVTEQWILSRIKIAVEPSMTAIARSKDVMKEFESLFNMTGKHVQIPPEYYTKDRVSVKPPYYRIVLDPNRIMKTFIKHNFPFGLSQDELKNEYSPTKLRTDESCDNVVKILIHKVFIARKYQIDNNLPATMSMDELMMMYYPSAMDAAALGLSMMLQAGWNKESVMDLDKNNFEHGLTATIEEQIKIVYAEKSRSQGTDVPYDSPKLVLARTDNRDPYSLYSLILLAKEVSAPIAKYADHLVDEIRNRPVNTMFSYVRSFVGWAKGMPVNTIDNGQMFPMAVTRMLSEHNICDNSERLTTAQQLTPRLRATWMYYNSDNTPFAFLSQLLGHASRDTTDEFYDNSSQARTKRTQRLRLALEHVVELLRARRFKGLLSKYAKAQDTAKLAIFHLPNFEKALWACRNRYRPDWPSAPTLPQGAKCVALEKCIFCSQLWILEDSLPYLIERLSHIDDLLRDQNYIEFGSQLEAEQEAINVIIEKWSDDEAIKHAINFRAVNSPLLPREMRDLKLIFTTGDLDE